MSAWGSWAGTSLTGSTTGPSSTLMPAAATVPTAQPATPTGSGSNQYATFPNANPTQNPNMNPSSTSGTTAGGTGSGASASFPGVPSTSLNIGGTGNLGGGLVTPGTLDPSFTGQFYSWLQQQVGPGAASQLGSLLGFLDGSSSSTPGANSLATMANTGDPVNQTPAWQAMVASENQNTQQNEANLKEQFAASGGLASTPYATAMANYLEQTNLDQNAQLTSAVTTEGDQAASRELTAGQGIQSEQSGLIQSLMSLLQSGALTQKNTATKETGAQAATSLLSGIGSIIGG